MKLNLRTGTVRRPAAGDAPVPAALFCVLDGHCGREAAEQAQHLLPDHVAAHMLSNRQHLQEVTPEPVAAASIMTSL